MESKIFRVLLGTGGLVAATFSLWFIETNMEEEDFEEKLSLKISLATLVFSIMMFTPVIDLDGGFIQLGLVAFPSTKLVADSIIMAFMASSLKDLIETDKEEESG